MPDDIFYFGCWGEAGHFLWGPGHQRIHRPPFPIEEHMLDGGPFLPLPERVGTGMLTRLDGWTVLAWWGGNPWDRRGKVCQSVVLRGETAGICRVTSLADVWAAFGRTFPDLAAVLRIPTLIDLEPTRCAECGHWLVLHTYPNFCAAGTGEFRWEPQRCRCPGYRPPTLSPEGV